MLVLTTLQHRGQSLDGTRAPRNVLLSCRLSTKNAKVAASTQMYVSCKRLVAVASKYSCTASQICVIFGHHTRAQVTKVLTGATKAMLGEPAGTGSFRIPSFSTF